MSLALYIDLEKAAVMRGGKKTPKVGAAPKVKAAPTPDSGAAADDGPAAPKLEGPPEGSYNWDGKGDPASRGFKQAPSGTWYKMPGSGKAEQPSEEGKVDPKADVAAEKHAAEPIEQTPSAEMAKPDSPELDGGAAETMQDAEVARQAGNEELAQVHDAKLEAAGGVPDQREAGTGEDAALGDKLVEGGEASKEQVEGALDQAAAADTKADSSPEKTPATRSKQDNVRDKETAAQERRAKSSQKAALNKEAGTKTDVDRTEFHSKVAEAEEATAAGEHERAEELYDEAVRELSKENIRNVEKKAKDQQAKQEAADADRKLAAKAKKEKEAKKETAAKEKADAQEKKAVAAAEAKAKKAVAAAEAKAKKDTAKAKDQAEKKKIKDELTAAKKKASEERKAAKEKDSKDVNKRIEQSTAAGAKVKEKQAKEQERLEAKETRAAESKQKQREAVTSKVEAQKHKMEMRNAKVDPGVDRTLYNENMKAADVMMDMDFPEGAADLMREAEKELTTAEQKFKQEAAEAKDAAKEEAASAKAEEKEAKAEDKELAAEAKAEAKDAKSSKTSIKDAMSDFKTGQAAGEVVSDAPLEPGAAAPLISGTVQAGTTGAAKLGHHLLADDDAAQKEDEKAGGTAQSSLGKSMREISLGQIKQILQNRGVDLAEKDYSLNSVRRGAEEELEHTDDVSEATKIAIDHLEEKPHYYKRLDVAMETPLKELMALDDTRKAMNGLYIDLSKAGAISNSSSSSAGDSSDPNQGAREYNESFSERHTGTGGGTEPADSVAKVDEENSLQQELESARDQDAERARRQGLTPDEEEDDTEDAEKSIGIDFTALANVAKVVKSINNSRVTPVEMEFLTVELGYTLEDVEKGIAKIAGRNRDRFTQWLCGRMHKSINVLR